MRYLFLFLVFLAGSWACQPEEPCISSATNRLVVSFMIRGTPAAPAPTADERAFRSIISTTANDPLWTDATELGRPGSNFILRLDPDRDTTTFVFVPIPQQGQPSPGDVDTLVLTYQRRYRLISPDCPLEVSYRELRVVRTTFDTALIVNTELVEPSTDTDVQVFY